MTVGAGAVAAPLPAPVPASAPRCGFGGAGATRSADRTRDFERSGDKDALQSSGRVASDPPAWLLELRAEARQLVGDRLDEKSEEMLRFAEEKIRQFDDKHAEVTDKLEEDLRRVQEQASRLQEDRDSMMDIIKTIQEQLDTAEAAAFSSGRFLPLSLPQGLGALLSGAATKPTKPTSPGGAAPQQSLTHEPALSGESAKIAMECPAPRTPPPAQFASPPAHLPSPPGLDGVMPCMGGWSPVKWSPGCGSTTAWGSSSIASSPSPGGAADEPLSGGQPQKNPASALAEFLRLPAHGAPPPGAAPPRPPPAASPPPPRPAAASPESPPSSPRAGTKSAPMPSWLYQSPDPRGSRASLDDDEELDAEKKDRLTVLKASPKPFGTPTTRHTTPRGIVGRGTPPTTPKMTLAERPHYGSLTPSLTPMKSPMVPPSPYVICEGGGCMFGFTLRIAHGVELGLDLEPCPMPPGTGSTGKESALLVKDVREDGAVAAWNRQCVGAKGAGKEVKEGDKIVAVNQLSEAELMLQECSEKRLLKFLIVRGEPDCPLPAGWGAPRVDASHQDASEQHFGALARQAMMQAALGSPPPAVRADDLFMRLAMHAPTPPPPPLPALGIFGGGEGFGGPPPLPLGSRRPAAEAAAKAPSSSVDKSKAGGMALAAQSG